jgi:hypothetical protein
MATDNGTPLDPQQQQQQQQQSSQTKKKKSMHQRTRSQDMVEDHNTHIIDEDPLLISQSLTYVTDDGSILHSFQSSPFSWGM